MVAWRDRRPRIYCTLSVGEFARIGGSPGFCCWTQTAIRSKNRNERIAVASGIDSGCVTEPVRSFRNATMTRQALVAIRASKA